jgi:hypothetical protein
MRWHTLISVAVGVAISACGPAPAPPSPRDTTASPSAPGLSERIDSTGWIEFESPRHKYTVSYPPGWEITPATADGGPTADSLESPSFDRLRGDGVTFLARSHSIPGDSEKLYDWIDTYVARVRSTNPECFRPTDEWRTIAIEGYYDGPFANGCESIAVVGGPGHAWEFRLIGDPNPELFDILLSGVDIDDESLDGP